MIKKWATISVGHTIGLDIFIRVILQFYHLLYLELYYIFGE